MEIERTQEIHLRPAVPNPVVYPPDWTTSSPLSDYYITLSTLPSSAEVQEYAAKRPRTHEEAIKLPIWALVCLWAGVALLLGIALLSVTVAYLVVKEGAFL